jgi:hypothetical protein
MPHVAPSRHHPVKDIDFFSGEIRHELCRTIPGAGARRGHGNHCTLRGVFKARR